MNSENYTAHADENGILLDRTFMCGDVSDVTFCLDEEATLTGGGFDVDPASDAKLQRANDVKAHPTTDVGKDPTKSIAGHGPTVFIGFDSEFVPGDAQTDNKILSLQFYVCGKRSFFSKIVYPVGDDKKQRPLFYKVIVKLLAEALESGAISEWPKSVVVCGFFLRIDLQAFGDLMDFKRKIDNVGGRASSVTSAIDVQLDDFEVARLLRSRTVTDCDGADGVLRATKVRFIDIGSHLAVGTSLAKVGDLLELPKLELPGGYTKDRMDLLLDGDKPAFELYGIRDAEIAVRFYMRLLDFSEEHTAYDGKLGDRKLPPTASGLAVKIFRRQLESNGVNFNAAFGVHEKASTVWNKTTGGVVTVKERVATPMHSIIAPFMSSCYSGGRNECYVFGPTVFGVYNDYDLAGAYTTGMVDLRHIDYENFRVTHDLADFVGHVLGFAYVEFAFPEDTRFPCLPVRNRDNGLIYPLQGLSFCTAPEIEVALNLGCKMTIKHGVVIPWLASDDRLFEPYVMLIRDLRKKYPKGGIDELYAKLLGNGLYGKAAQGLKKKTVFDSRSLKSVELPHSMLTNAAIAAHTTGFIRAVLSEQIAGVPSHRTVVSATTDGFLTDADECELDFSGVMAKRYQALCERVAPGEKMLVRKHRVRQVIAMKTRGQLTAMPFEQEPIVLAKAGVSPGAATLDHNSYMVNLFMNRKPGDKTTTRPFTPFRDQWVKDVDVVRLTREARLNLEFDFKRRLIDPRMIAVDQGEHVSCASVPWNNLAECERARAVFTGWRANRCLQTVGDFDNWEGHYRFSLVQDRLKSVGGGKGSSVRVTENGVVDVMRRMFLRAYTQELCGLKKTLSNPKLAAWLTDKGYKTTINELKNAGRGKFVEHAVPAIPQVITFCEVLKQGFPAIDISRFLECNS